MDENIVVSNLKKKIQSLRKKLREIERLQHVSRPLNKAEEDKVLRKNEFRIELRDALFGLPVRLDKCQDSVPTAQLICDTIDEDEPSVDQNDDDCAIADPVMEAEDASSQEEELTDVDQQVPNTEIDVSAEKDQTSTKTKNRPQKRDVELHDLEAKTNGDSARASPRPSSPKRIKKEGSESKDVASKPKPKKTKKKAELPELSNLEKIWRSSEFTVGLLEGHNDVISAVCVDGNIVVSASRDTTVKVWNAETCQEVFSLRGHKGAVTCLTLLDEEASSELARYSGFGGSHRLAISGAADSTIILWSVTSGELKKSIYTFNTVTCVAYIQPDVCFITATDNGKLEIYDAVSGSNIRSLTAYDDGYSCVVSKDKFVFTAASDGIIKVWEVLDRNLTSVFTMDDLSLPEGMEITLRGVRSLTVQDDWVYYGDDGPNLKCFNWRTKEVKKFINQMCECGATDSVMCMSQEVIASSYDIDTGKGHINVRLHPSGQYLCSLEDNSTGRICCLAATTSNGTVRVITGGAQLKVWDVLQAPHSGRRVQQQQRNYLKPQYVSYYTRVAEQSDYESSGEDDTCSEDSQSGDRFERVYIPREITQPSMWSYCSVL